MPSRRIERAPDGLFEGEEPILHLMGRKTRGAGCARGRTEWKRGGSRAVLDPDASHKAAATPIDVNSAMVPPMAYAFA